MLGYLKKINEWLKLPSLLAILLFLSIVMAYLVLTLAFLEGQFQILYVANHSNSLLPLIYKVTAVWGGHEGSMLLWMLFLSIWILAVSRSIKSIPLELSALMLAVLGAIAFGILSFIYLTSNPFLLAENYIYEGADLNPLLQDPGMAIHPPMLYLGYVGLAIPFAFSVASLIIGKLEPSFIAWLRPWILLSWSCLTIGITLGSWWAYYELGWGGWWFWDPVENASFMPWLIATALIHSAAVTQSRGLFKSWFILLCIIGFSLSLLGTFLVRSGVLVSVHAFAADPGRGLFILLLIAIILGGSLFLFAFRANQLNTKASFSYISKESFLLLNNFLLLIASLSILLGTLYPLIVDALGLGKISVGAPYFEIVFLYLMMPLMIAVGIGIHADWIKAKDFNFKKLLYIATIFMVAVLAAIFVWTSSVSFLTVFGFWSAGWIALSTIYYGIKLRVARNNRSLIMQLPMMIAHIGLGVFILGVTFVNNYSLTTDQAVQMNQSINFAGSEWLFSDLNEVEGPNYRAIEAEIIYTNDDDTILFYPQRRIYTQNQNAMTEAAIDGAISRDLFVAIGDAIDSNEWQFRFQYRPFIRCIWFGALIMALGGLLAAFKHYFFNKSDLIKP